MTWFINKVLEKLDVIALKLETLITDTLYQGSPLATQIGISSPTRALPSPSRKLEPSHLLDLSQNIYKDFLATAKFQNNRINLKCLGSASIGSFCRICFDVSGGYIF